MTDEFVNYYGLAKDYEHRVVNHLDKYVEGNIHTQGIENFLVAAKAWPGRDICCCRAIPPVSLR